MLLLGSATAWPLVTRAEKPGPVVGFISIGYGDANPTVVAFRRGLSETGYVEGQNVSIEFRFAEGHYDRQPALVAELVDRKVDVIYAQSGPIALLVKRATATIPTIFLTGGDPVADGLVASLARPGGNLTGMSLLAGDLLPKQLEVVLELIPRARTVALLANPANSFTQRLVLDMQRLAAERRIETVILHASSESEIDAAFASAAQLQAGALVVGTDGLFTARRQQLVAQAAHYAIPTVYYLREFTNSGGLVSYGASLGAAARQMGIYAGRILKGENPADLPVQQPTKFELVINTRTAAALGLIVPPSLLARADELIE